jgi:hypothetical protein
VLRNTLVLEIAISNHLTLREEFKVHARPGDARPGELLGRLDPLCRGYALTSTTVIVLSLEL